MKAKNRYLYSILVFFAAIFLSISLTCVVSYAVPALEIPREVTQPSGEKLKVTLRGDEWFNYTSAENGDLVVKGEDGYWYYGEAGTNGLNQSSAKYKINAKPTHAQTVKDVKDLRKSSYAEFEKTNGTPVPNQSSGFAQAQDTLPGAVSASAAAVTGTQKVLVILVSFTNATIGNADIAWSNELFGETGKTLKNYFKENSQNNFYFSPATESYGTANDGVVRVTLSYAHPDTQDAIDSRNKKIVSDAITAADAYVNFSLFDTNTNGTISVEELHILTVVAGNDHSCGDSSPCIWPHSWSTYAYQVKDGKTIAGGYTQIADKQSGHMTTIGVVAHELGHDIGLPDLYDTDGSSDGIGVYSLMASGTWGRASGEYSGTTPTHLDAWSKIKLGFATPVTTVGGIYSMNTVANGGYNILKIATSDPKQYFLVENRQLTGFDAGLAYYNLTGGGIAIFHVDDSVTTNNVDETHKLVDLEEANEVAYGGRQLDDKNAKGLAYNNLFRLGTNILFNYATTPNSALYSGVATNISIGVPGSYAASMTVNVNIRTIVFNSNGGTAVATITQPAGTGISKPADPLKTGYTLGGWYSDVGLTALVTWPYTLGATNVTFYAKWTANTYTIKYNGNGSTGGTTVSSIHTYDAASNLTANGFAKTGNTFLGWSAAPGGAKVYNNTQSVINLTTISNDMITFYAVWQINNYNITFNANGGTGGWGPTSLVYGAALTAPAVTRTGYTFSNWSPSAPSTVPAANTTYTAQWTLNVYEVAFDLNGASGTVPLTQSGPVGTGVQLPVQGDRMKPFYIFLGWSLSKDSQVPLTSCQIEAPGIVLYAVWERVPVSLGVRQGSTAIINGASGFIFGLTPAMMKNLFESSFVSVNGDGRLEYSNAQPNLGTGIKAALIDNVTGITAAAYTIVIFGDVNGDGNIDSMDAGKIVDYENDVITWDPITDAARYKAGDLNGDGNIDSMDAGIAVDAENKKININQMTGLAY